MTIEERAIAWSRQYIGKSRRDITCIAYEMGASEQKKIDLNAIELVLYNAVEIGDVSCNDIKKLIESIKRSMANPPESTR